MSNEITKVNNALPIKSMQDFQVLGESFAKSGLLGITNPAAGMVVAMTCYQEGITPIDFSRTYHIVDGKPSMKADAMLAKFVSIGGKYKILSNTRQEASAQFIFNDNDIVVTKTIEEMTETGVATTKNGALKDNWKKFTDAMLWARVVSSAIRLIAPQVVNGIYTPEEEQDFSESEQNETVVIPPLDIKMPTVVQAMSESTIQDAKIVDEDYTVCPIGKSIGIKWEDMETEHLNLALTIKDEKMKSDHLEVIQSVINSRTGEYDV